MFHCLFEVGRVDRSPLLRCETCRWVCETTIRKSKNDQYRQGDEVVLARSVSHTRPGEMLKRYMALGEVDRSSEAALFCPIIHFKSRVSLTRQGPLSYSRTRELVKEALRRAGLNPSKYGRGYSCFTRKSTRSQI